VHSGAVSGVNIYHHISIEKNPQQRCFSANARQRGSFQCSSNGNADPNAAAVAKSIAATRSSAIFAEIHYDAPPHLVAFADSCLAKRDGECVGMRIVFDFHGFFSF
jgi:hypothetical protein